MKVELWDLKCQLKQTKNYSPPPKSLKRGQKTSLILEIVPTWGGGYPINLVTEVS